MKKNILSLIIMVAICTATNAQDVIYGGFKLSPNYSIYNKSLTNQRGTVNQGSGIGYSIGYFEVLELTNKINIQAEVNYNTISFSQKDSAGGSPMKYVTERQSFTNLELPIMVKYRVADNFAIGVGYQFNLLNKNFRKSQKVTIDTEDNRTTEDVEEFDIEKQGTTQGLIIDASFKANNIIAGLRILSPANPLNTVTYVKDNVAEPVERKANLNVALYVGIALFR